jgi:TadE-like protein
MVEFALALPVLLWLMCGLLDIGRAYYYGVTVTDAARDGVRVLVTNTGGYGPGTAAGCASVQAAVVDVASSPTCPSNATQPGGGQVLVGISCPDNLCVGDPDGASHYQALTVDVYYGYQPLTPFISLLVPGGVITLHGRAVMDATW